MYEKELQKNPNKRGVRQQMEMKKHQINIIEQEELAQKIKSAKQNYFENANKPGRWLAYKLRKEEKKMIYNLHDRNGELQSDREKKKKIVFEYYQQLYGQETVEQSKIDKYIEDAKLPKIPEDIKTMLNRKITMMELMEAINKQKNGKTPGPDGLPAEFYKSMQEFIATPLLQILNELMEKTKIPESWTEAYITLIPKEGTDLQQIQNYRPISLLNVDYKIFTSIMAERLKRYLSEFIHIDQNGFLPKRQIRDNVRIVLDALEFFEIHPEKEMAMMFLDAQKAFDNVNWQFMIIQLKKMGFGDRFIKVIEAIYEKQTAKVIVNGEMTEKINIQKGTRQGCPLSPLLFILTLEILNRDIRCDEQIKGLRIKKEEYKLQAFADDLVFIMEDPLGSGLRLIERIEKYGDVAGLKINKDKTKIIVKNLTDKKQKEMERRLGIQIVKKVKYLGILISARCSTIKKDNYDKLMKQIHEDLERWKNLQVSLMGRIATIKMNVLPRLLYLFQTVPIHLEKSFFDELNKTVTKFIWKGKKPRIKLKLLQDARERGGFGLPNWEIYYQCAGLVWVKEWIQLKDERLLTLEGHDLQLGWHAFLWYQGQKTHKYFTRHTIRKALLINWEKTRKQQYLKIPVWVSPMEACTYPNLINLKKILRYKEILDENGKLKKMEELRLQDIDITWYTYRQIHSRYERDKHLQDFYDGNTELDDILTGKDEKLIARLYEYMLRFTLAEEQVKETMIVWAQNFGYNIPLDEWEKLWERNYSISISTAHRENMYKMFYRWHFDPARLAKMFKNKSMKCWKCQQEPGTYYHMWWTCKEARKYWLKIREWLEKMTMQLIEMKPEIFLLGLIPKSYSKEDAYLMIHILTAARIVFAQYWKEEKTPNEKLVINKILECAEMNRLTLMIKEKEDSDYFNIWQVFYRWLKERG